MFEPLFEVSAPFRVPKKRLTEIISLILSRTRICCLFNFTLIINVGRTRTVEPAENRSTRGCFLTTAATSLECSSALILLHSSVRFPISWKLFKILFKKSLTQLLLSIASKKSSKFCVFFWLCQVISISRNRQHTTHCLILND
jgi:hypothetical protein